MTFWIGWCAYSVLSSCAVLWRAAESGVALGDKSPAVASIQTLETSDFGMTNLSFTIVDWHVDLSYDIIVSFMESRLSMLILLNFVCCLCSVLAFAVKDLFFGRLSEIESHRLTERAIKYTAFKVVFVGAYVSPDIVNVTAWFVWFALLGLVKIFVGLCKDRLDGLMSAPSATRVKHCQNFGLLALLFVGNIWGSCIVFSKFWGGAMSELFLLMFECALIAIDSCQTLLRYGFYFMELMRQSKFEEPLPDEQGLGAHATSQWQGTVLYYAELWSEMVTLCLTLCHYCHIWCLHGFAFQLIDGILFLNIRSMACSIKGRLQAFLRYLAATHNLSAIFPDAQTRDLVYPGDDCAICKEHMVAAKKLPCGHIFHLYCLRAWLQQSGSDNFTCPVCRAPLFLRPGESRSEL